MNMIDKLKFDEKGLIPAIVVDGTSGQVLTLAYMNRESLELSIKEGRTCFYSRSYSSCFHNPLWTGDEAPGFSLDGLMEMLQGRKEAPKEGSYTSYLFEKGLDKILKKVGEECTEVIIAGKAEDKAETVYEIADLAYHVMVLMLQLGISLEDVEGELAKRHVIDKKVKQEKMV